MKKHVTHFNTLNWHTSTLNGHAQNVKRDKKWPLALILRGRGCVQWRRREKWLISREKTRHHGNRGGCGGGRVINPCRSVGTRVKDDRLNYCRGSCWVGGVWYWIRVYCLKKSRVWEQSMRLDRNRQDPAISVVLNGCHKISIWDLELPGSLTVQTRRDFRLESALHDWPITTTSLMICNLIIKGCWTRNYLGQITTFGWLKSADNFQLCQESLTSAKSPLTSGSTGHSAWEDCRALCYRALCYRVVCDRGTVLRAWESVSN